MSINGQPSPATVCHLKLLELEGKLSHVERSLLQGMLVAAYYAGCLDAGLKAMNESLQKSIAFWELLHRLDEPRRTGVAKRKSPHVDEIMRLRDVEKWSFKDIARYLKDLDGKAHTAKSVAALYRKWKEKLTPDPKREAQQKSFQKFLADSSRVLETVNLMASCPLYQRISLLVESAEENLASLNGQ